MASALKYLFLFLTLGIPIYEFAAVFQDATCVPDEHVPCFDLSVVAKIAKDVSKVVIAADGKNILLKHNFFDKIRKKKELHSCVLHKIIDLFQDVLVETQRRSFEQHIGEINHHELIYIMDQLRNCVYKIKKGCDYLYQKADTTQNLKVSKNLRPKQVAILQLQKLMYASERIEDVNIQDRVMDELKLLHFYMHGKGFRENRSD
ncbi:uncharacterized protein LOC127436952 [Myxocyprinus asiaticus]|uniref:uncharacterized protein LOC127436952 n=1 Tax=Myxocyprinus asiaticus TaxID=70543 RepID=UPI0022216C73|nr:uncharacterized protein LOC127436952 [Myxocyprinus asiaticus]